MFLTSARSISLRDYKAASGLGGRTSNRTSDRAAAAGGAPGGAGGGGGSGGGGGRSSTRINGDSGTAINNKRAPEGTTIGTAATTAATATTTATPKEHINTTTAPSQQRRLSFMNLLPISTSATTNNHNNNSKIAPEPEPIISHRQQGSQRISLRDEPPAMYLMFEIKDMGIGIAQDVMDALFAPFKQAQRFAGGRAYSVLTCTVYLCVLYKNMYAEYVFVQELC